MINKRLELFYDLVTEAHAQIQKDYKNINPVVSVNQKMRTVGIPADVITIDCLKSNKRIIMVLHDDEPDTISYQFSFKDKDPTEEFEKIDSEGFSSKIIYSLIVDYFS